MVDCQPHELFLSFLPLSHTLERTGGYYLPMMLGATVAYNRSIPQLGDDLLAIRPTIMIAVPRIFERVYNKLHAALDEKSAVIEPDCFNVSLGTFVIESSPTGMFLTIKLIAASRLRARMVYIPDGMRLNR